MRSGPRCLASAPTSHCRMPGCAAITLWPANGSCGRVASSMVCNGATSASSRLARSTTMPAVRTVSRVIQYLLRLPAGSTQSSATLR